MSHVTVEVTSLSKDEITATVVIQVPQEKDLAEIFKKDCPKTSLKERKTE